MDAFSGNRRARKGFTLIEMLTVVMIIGILATLVAGAAVMAKTAVKRSVIKAEIASLDGAIKAFKEKYGDYPPDFSDANAVRTFLGRMFPRVNANNLTLPTTVKSPAGALVFWLGGMTISSGNGVQIIGFSQDPMSPFDTSANSLGSRIGPFFDFDPSRIQIVNNEYVYMPPGVGDTDPYVYFRARNNPTTGPNYNNIPPCSFSHSDGTNSSVKPCYDLRRGAQAWANASSFQIRAPGLDGRFGGGVQFPAGSDYKNWTSDPVAQKFQYDDLSNFSQGTFEDEMQ